MTVTCVTVTVFIEEYFDDDMTKVKLLPFLAALTISISSCSPVAPTKESTVAPTVVIEATLISSPSRLPQTEAEVPRVSVEDAVAAIKNGEAVVLDVRSADAYQASHIPGALSVPLFDIEKNPTGLNLDKNKWIITYCT